MKLSELKAKLLETETEFGDMEVVFEDWDERENRIDEVEVVTYRFDNSKRLVLR